MRLTQYLAQLLGLSATIHQWHTALGRLEAERRERIARYAEAIAATLSRAAAALAALQSRTASKTANANAARNALREFARIAGYVEDIVRALEDQLDGRKLAGVKRRLDRLSASSVRLADICYDADRIESLLEAEGYFRALADGLRAVNTKSSRTTAGAIPWRTP